MPHLPDTLATTRWTELRGRRPALLVPLGSCEQHGPHLPLATDTIVAVAVAERAAAAVGGGTLIVAPPVTYGASGEHRGFPGTLSIGTEALATLVVELVRSADDFDGVVLVNGHGGNRDAVEEAVARLRKEGRDPLAWWPDLPDADAHAGRTETSLLLALAPAQVDPARIEPGRTEPLADLWPELRSGGVAAVSPNGVLGDPRGATAAEGEQLLARLVQSCADAVVAWWAARRLTGTPGRG